MRTSQELAGSRQRNPTPAWQSQVGDCFGTGVPRKDNKKGGAHKDNQGGARKDNQKGSPYNGKKVSL